MSGDEKNIEKTPKLTRGAGEHDFWTLEQFFEAPETFHGRFCKKCGLIQRYGRQYGSNKYPDYVRIDPNCPPLGKKGR